MLLTLLPAPKKLSTPLNKDTISKETRNVENAIMYLNTGF